MARKHPLKCSVGSKRFTVIEVCRPHSRLQGECAGLDTHAGRNFEAALRSAQPDRNSELRVYVTCASDAGAARLPSNFKKHGKFVKKIRYKRGG